MLSYLVVGHHHRMHGSASSPKYPICGWALDRDPTVEEKFSWIELLAEKKMWREILEMEKLLVSHQDWHQLPGGKDTLTRIRLAKAMVITKRPVDKVPEAQQSLF